MENDIALELAKLRKELIFIKADMKMAVLYLEKIAKSRDPYFEK